MALFSPRSFRQIALSSATSGSCIHQRRWARVLDVRYLATHGAQERVLAKYRDRLDQKARQEGHDNVDSLRAAYESKIKALRKAAAVDVPSNSRPSTHASFQDPPPPPPQPVQEAPTPRVSAASDATKIPGLKTLSAFVDVDRLRTLSIKEIEQLWRLRHASTDSSLCAIIPTHIWGTVHANALKHPQFILPLPREGQEGAEIHFLQWAFPAPDTVAVLFTNLAEYKLRGEYATPHTTVTHHMELVGDKGVVLAQGNVTSGRGVSVEEGKWLFMCLQKFYGLQGEQNGGRKKLLEQFSKGDDQFRIQELLDEAEKAG